jgi:hypothetical protein
VEFVHNLVCINSLYFVVPCLAQLVHKLPWGICGSITNSSRAFVDAWAGQKPVNISPVTFRAALRIAGVGTWLPRHHGHPLPSPCSLPHTSSHQFGWVDDPSWEITPTHHGYPFPCSPPHRVPLSINMDDPSWEIPSLLSGWPHHPYMF